MEAPKLIEAKARDILRHYVENILPSGLKAQIVAYSRLAAIRYTAALDQARDELVAEAEATGPKLRELDDVALESKPRKVRAAVRAWRCLAMLKQIEFATVIPGGKQRRSGLQGVERRHQGGRAHHAVQEVLGRGE